MQKLKIMCVIFIFISILGVIRPIYADDESQEVDVTPEEIEEILEATSEAVETPIINSRNAIVYDRISRKNIIWEEGKY